MNDALPENETAPAEKTGMDPRAAQIEELITEWITLPEIAELLDVRVTAVHRLISDGTLIAWRVGEDRIRKVPALFMSEGRVLEPLRGTISVLADAGFDEADMLLWLYAQDESLPGRPIDALHEGRKKEIRRRAQSMAW